MLHGIASPAVRLQAPLLKSDDGVPSPPVGACCHVGPVPLHSIQPRSQHSSFLAEAAAMLLEAACCRPAAMLLPMGQIQSHEDAPRWEQLPMAWVWSAAWGWRADALKVLAQNDGLATMYMPMLPAAAAVCCHRP